MNKDFIKHIKKISIPTFITALIATPLIALATTEPYGGSDITVGHQSGTTPCLNAPISESKICWDRQADRNNVGGINAMRASLVDGNGNRVSGTISIDLVGNDAVGASAVSDFQEFTIIHDTSHPWNGIGSLNPPAGSTNIDGETGKGITIMTYDGTKGNKNEFATGRGQVTRVSSFSEIKTYKWSAISNYVYQSKNVRSIVSNIYYNDFSSIKKLLSLMHYDLGDRPTSVNDYNAYYDQIKDYYLLLEPVVYVQETYGSTRYGATLFAVYGTVTEVKYIINNYFNIPIQTPIESNFWTEIYSASQRILVGQTVRDGALRDVTAGLHYTTTVNQVAALNELTTPLVGQGSGHFWLRGECSDPCSCGVICEDREHEFGTCAVDNLKIDLANCNSGKTSGTVEDTEDWNCILRQANASKNTYEGQFYVNLQIAERDSQDASMVTNNYCNIACRETISYRLPSNLDVRFDAGYRFSIGANNSEITGIPDLSPITFTGIKECQTALPPAYLNSLGSKVLTNSNSTNGVSDASVVNNTYIDVERFKTEYEQANKAVINAWDAYQEALLEKRAADKVNAKNDNQQTGTKQTGVHTITAGSYTQSNTFTCTASCGTCGTNVEGNITWEEIDINNEHSGDSYTAPSPWRPSGCGTCVNICTRNQGTSTSPTTCTYTVYKYQESYVTYYGVTKKSSVKEYKECPNGVWHEDASYDQNIINERKAAYDQAVAYRDLLLRQIQQCNTYIDEYSEFDPQVNFAYRDYSYMDFFTLKRTESYTSHPIYYKNSSSGNLWTATPTTDLIARADCTGNESCKSGLKTRWVNGTQVVEYDNRSEYPTNRQMKSTKEIIYDYQAPNNSSYLYRSIDGKMFKSEPAAIQNGVEYTVYGDSTLPVSFDNGTGQQCYRWYNEWQASYSGTFSSTAWTTQGRLDWILDFYYDTAKEVNLFGKNQKYNKYKDIITVSGLQPFNDSLYTIFTTGQVAGADFGYLCLDDELAKKGGRNIDNCITGCCNPPCNPQISCEGGINVIYRPISLFNAFPGISGTGRTPGDNWNNYIRDGENYISFEERYITNNRGVKTNQVYTLTPMYEFVLTPYNIGQIRGYNDNQKNNYNDLETLTCDENNTHCKSSFLDKGSENGYFNYTINSGGTCMNNNNDWESCR